MAIALSDAGRFRVNVFKQRGEVGMVIRAIRSRIPSIEELNLPQVLKDVIMTPRGLVLVVGSTGSGKSTSLAAMIGYRNQNSTGHIITIEDPVEYQLPGVLQWPLDLAKRLRGQPVGDEAGAVVVGARRAGAA